MQLQPEQNDAISSLDLPKLHPLEAESLLIDTLICRVETMIGKKYVGGDGSTRGLLSAALALATPTNDAQSDQGQEKSIVFDIMQALAIIDGKGVHKSAFYISRNDAFISEPAHSRVSVMEGMIVQHLKHIENILTASSQESQEKLFSSIEKKLLKPYSDADSVRSRWLQKTSRAVAPNLASLMAKQAIREEFKIHVMSNRGDRPSIRDILNSLANKYGETGIKILMDGIQKTPLNHDNDTLDAFLHIASRWDEFAKEGFQAGNLLTLTPRIQSDIKISLSSLIDSKQKAISTHQMQRFLTSLEEHGQNPTAGIIQDLLSGRSDTVFNTLRTIENQFSPPDLSSPNSRFDVFVHKENPNKKILDRLLSQWASQCFHGTKNTKIQDAIIDFALKTTTTPKEGEEKDYNAVPLILHEVVSDYRASWYKANKRLPLPKRLFERQDVPYEVRLGLFRQIIDFLSNNPEERAQTQIIRSILLQEGIKGLVAAETLSEPATLFHARTEKLSEWHAGLKRSLATMIEGALQHQTLDEFLAPFNAQEKEKIAMLAKGWFPRENDDIDSPMSERYKIEKFLALSDSQIKMLQIIDQSKQKFTLRFQVSPRTTPQQVDQLQALLQEKFTHIHTSAMKRIDIFKEDAQLNQNNEANRRDEQPKKTKKKTP